MYAVIMAGGGGTRLWPLSRERRPKPFLPLLEGGRCLLAATVSRVAPLVGPEDVFVVTDARYASLVAELAPEVPPGNVIGEPSGRNTAAAVALAAHAIDRPEEEVMAVLPADQAVRDEPGFRAALAAAAERAAAGRAAAGRAAAARAGGADMVTLGIEPTEPNTGYGYVVAEGDAEAYGGCATYRVVRFEEKPTPERAAELVATGDAYWNAGIFVWRRDTLLEGLARHAPDITGPIADAVARGDLEAVYPTLRATSIDYALLEPASLEGRVAVVPAAIGWSDLGSWSALRDHRGGAGRPVVTAESPAQVIDVDGRDVLVHAAGGRTVAVVGLDGVIVVDTPDALLVSSAEASQDVRKVVERLRAEGRSDLL